MIDTIGDRCTGCYACVNKCPKNCIEMHENEEGFWYPEILTDQCIKCNLCEKTCPVLTPISINKSDSDIKVYAVKHKNEEIRAKSSSGGAFSAIAEYVLSQGGVVFGAAFDENWDVHHIYVETTDDLQKLRGSKYVQSRIGNCYQQAEHFLKAGRLVYFTGTACQTSGLIGYLGHDYDNLITQDLICHGVPSPMIWRKYIKFRKKLERSDITNIFFRSKEFGWHDWHFTMDFQNGTHYSQSQHQDLMMQAFLHGKCSRKTCYDCPFKQKVRLADFTLADYWGIQDIAPQLDDDHGLSSCYVNSPKAERVIHSIKDKVELCEMDLNDAIDKNLAMIESEAVRPDREEFLGDMRKKPFDIVVGQYIMHIGTSEKVLWTIRRILGNKNYNKFKKILRKG